MAEDTRAFLKTGHKSFLTKKLFNVEDIFRDVLSSDAENIQHWESLGPAGARALRQNIFSKSIVKPMPSPGKKCTVQPQSSKNERITVSISSVQCQLKNPGKVNCTLSHLTSRGYICPINTLYFTAVSVLRI